MIALSTCNDNSPDETENRIEKRVSHLQFPSDRGRNMKSITALRQMRVWTDVVQIFPPCTQRHLTKTQKLTLEIFDFIL